MGSVAYTCNPRTQGMRQEGYQFEDIVDNTLDTVEEKEEEEE